MPVSVSESADAHHAALSWEYQLYEYLVSLKATSSLSDAFPSNIWKLSETFKYSKEVKSAKSFSIQDVFLDRQS